jgi:hypothetical protein
MRDVLLPYKSLLTEELVAQLLLVTAIDGDEIEWSIYLPTDPPSDDNVIGKIALNRNNGQFKSNVYLDNLERISMNLNLK